MINQRNLLRGSIWLVDPDPTIGHEQGKKRPCLILSANEYHQGSSKLAIIAPITSKYRTLTVKHHAMVKDRTDQ